MGNNLPSDDENEGTHPTHPKSNFRPVDGDDQQGGDVRSLRDDDRRPNMVTDTLGPKIVQGGHEMTDMLAKQTDHWQQLHTLLQVYAL